MHTVTQKCVKFDEDEDEDRSHVVMEELFNRLSVPFYSYNRDGKLLLQNVRLK